MQIERYLTFVFIRLKDYIEKGGDIRKLKGVSFQGVDHIDYDDKQVQELYILRYVYSYAFEYKMMFSEILSRFEGAEKLNILSLGCGPLPDYWGLGAAYAEDYNGIDRDNIQYTGVDLIDWNYKDFSSIKIARSFVQMDFIEYLKNNDISDVNVVFFPKSICEIPMEKMDQLCSALSDGLKKNKIALGVSLRNIYDVDRIQMIADAMAKKGYISSEIINNKDYSITDEEGNITDYQPIQRLDEDFKYPPFILNYLKTLSDKVTDPTDEEAEELKGLNRNPITKTKYIQYEIVIFERVQA